MGLGKILKGINHFQLLRRFQFISGSETLGMLLSLTAVRTENVAAALPNTSYFVTVKGEKSRCRNIRCLC
jgi:hypothetical protein